MERINKNPLIVAEIGTAHNANLSKGKELLYKAKESGADAVKTQIVFADEILHPLSGSIELPGGSIALYDRFKELETDFDFFFSLNEFAKSINLEFFAAPFGIKSFQWLRDLELPYVKIASPELNHLPLLQACNEYKKPVILSTGVSKLGDIELALEALTCPVTLLHCVTQYPAEETAYNILLVQNLSHIFQVPVGISDHSLHPWLIPCLALSQGAVIIEKHFTLSNDDRGLDDPIALTPQAFSQMSKKLHSFYGSTERTILEELRNELGKERIAAVLGSGAKRLSSHEHSIYASTNRSIHAIQDIPKDGILDISNIDILRSEKNLNPGLHPAFLSIILGRRSSKSIKNGAGITWEDLLLP